MTLFSGYVLFCKQGYVLSLLYIFEGIFAVVTPPAFDEYLTLMQYHFKSRLFLRCRAIPAPTVRRLMSAVSFGYGLFHLAVSLLPPKLLNIIHFLGFEGDRQTGIQVLLFSRQGSDMRAPLAT